MGEKYFRSISEALAYLQAVQSRLRFGAQHQPTDEFPALTTAYVYAAWNRNPALRAFHEVDADAIQKANGEAAEFLVRALLRGESETFRRASDHLASLKLLWLPPRQNSRPQSIPALDWLTYLCLRHFVLKLLGKPSQAQLKETVMYVAPRQKALRSIPGTHTTDKGVVISDSKFGKVCQRLGLELPRRRSGRPAKTKLS
ncbi:MAG: hypothetical protein ACR2OZ_07015 [Verrucomicrobiales bacterium]